MSNKRKRPWKVFVQSIGPTYSFATEVAAKRRARELAGEYLAVDVYNWSTTERLHPMRRTRYRSDGAVEVQELDFSSGWKVVG